VVLTDENGVATDRNSIAKFLIGCGIACCQLLLLCPGRAGANEDIG
jgi:hypothetical protein